jgi:hypothetical protein
LIQVQYSPAYLAASGQDLAVETQRSSNLDYEQLSSHPDQLLTWGATVGIKLDNAGALYTLIISSVPVFIVVHVSAAFLASLEQNPRIA